MPGHLDPLLHQQPDAEIPDKYGYMATLVRVLTQDIKIKTRCLAGSVQSSLPRTGL